MEDSGQSIYFGDKYFKDGSYKFKTSDLDD